MADSSLVPLHGTVTHPLSAHAIAELKELLRWPLARSTVNPGVVNRLLRDGLVEIVALPSPFPSHKGSKIDHLRITEAGERRALYD